MELDTDELLDEDFLEASCLADPECVQELIKDAPYDCAYCAIESLEDEEE